MELKILEHIDFEKVNILLDGFNKSTGFVTAIVDHDGNVLSKSGWRKICTEFHRTNPETSKKCILSDTVLAEQMGKGEKYHCYNCLNGLVDVAVPITIRGEHIANLFTGQLFLQKPDISFFKKQAARYGFDETAYLKALEEVPVISEERVKVVIDFLQNLAHLIVEISYQKEELSQLNDKLTTNKERQRLILENSMDAILLTSPDGSILSANPAACSLFQRSEEELCRIGRNAIVDLNDPRLPVLIKERELTGKAKGELQMLRKDGSKFPVEISTSVFRDIEGRLLSSMIIRDISERKKSEEELLVARTEAKENEINFRLVVENAPEAIFVQVGSKFAYVNKAALDLYGAISEEQLIGTSILDRIHPDFTDLVTQRIEQLNEKQLAVTTTEYKHLRLDNSVVDVSVSAVPFKFQNKDGALVFVKDITERKQIGEKLQKSYDLLKNLAEQVPGVIYQYRLYPDGRSAFPYSSPGMYQIYEVTSEDVREDASPVFSRIHPDDYDLIVKTINDSAKNQTEYHSEFRVLLPKQGLRWRSCNATPELLGDGSTLWHGIIMDITDRKMIEELYKQKSEEINTFFNCALDLLCIANMDGYFLRLNKEWENVLGYSLDELQGSRFIDYVHPDDIEQTLQAVVQLSNQDKIYSFTNRYRCKNGTYKWIEWKSHPVGNIMYGAARDITDRILKKQELKNALNRIEKSEEIFRKAFYTNPEAITINNMESGMYISVNNGFVRMLEYSEEETLGRSSKELNIWSDFTEREVFINKLKAEGIIENFEAKFRTKSGKIIDCLVSSAVIELDNSPHIISITRDFTERIRIEKELLESKEQLRFAFEGSNDGLWDVNMKTREVYINSRGCEILGYLPHEMNDLARIWSERVHPDDITFTNNNLQAHIEDKTPVFEVEQRLRAKSGDWKWVLSRGKIVSRDANGVPLRMTGTLTDISERVAFKDALILKNMELEASEEEIRAANEELMTTYDSLKESNASLEDAKKDIEVIAKNFENIFTNSPVGIFVIDVNEQGNYFINTNNPAHEKIVGLQNDLVSGKPLEILIEIAGIEVYNYVKELYNNIVLSGQTVDIEENIQVNNRKLVSNTTIRPLFDSNGKVYRLIGTNLDISQLKLTEQELILAKERAEESDRLKTAFLQNMSHEIRTPMNAIMGFSELLSREYNNREKVEHYSEIINQRCNDLLDIINDLLDIAKIESGQLPVKIQKCNVNKLFTELTSFYEEYLIRQKKQNITLNFQMSDDNVNVLADKGKFKQILLNLIGNAIKFTNKGSIDVGYFIESQFNITFYVKDNGIGIPLDKQEKIFDRFAQVDNGTSRLYGGTGLGLSIVKGLLNLLGGRIWLDSEPGKGSNFYFSLPLCKSEVDEKENILQENFNPATLPQNKTILIVEDDQYNAEFIGETLSNNGFNLIYSINGEDAVEVALNKFPDIILMDIGLPDISGYEAVRRIKAQKPELTIIAQTAYAAEEDKFKALDAGCDDYISKPLKHKALLAIVNKYLKNA